MRTPAWWAEDGAVPRLLAPLGALYAAATARRVARAGAKVPVPVVCAGNLTAGGTVKTPLAAWLLSELAARGVCAHVVSRGHGGRARGPLRVDPARHAAGEVGDEPLLLAGHGPVWVAKDRMAGARAAVAAGARALILDDGFQDPAPAKDLSILVVDAEAGFGNGRPIPAGPLREHVAAGLARADVALLLGPPVARRAFAPRLAPVPVAEGEVAPLPTGMDWRGLRVLAFAGIGRPEKFFDALRGQGAEILRAVPLADHAPITPALLKRLLREARGLNARLVTTEKDLMRLPSALRREVLHLPVRLEVAPGGPLGAALDALARTSREV